MADEDTGRVLSGTVGTLAACLEHLRSCERCRLPIAGDGIVTMRLGDDGHVRFAVSGREVRQGWIGYGPNGEVLDGGPAGYGVVQPGALDEPGVAQRYEAAGFDFEEVKRTAQAAAAGASPDGRTEGSQASREQIEDWADAVCGDGFIDIAPESGDLVRIYTRAEAVHLWVRLGEAILKQGWGPLIGGIDWARNGH